MDETRQQEIQIWIAKGSQDLQSAQWLLESPDALNDAVGFHCQQAAEKVLKAYLTWREVPFERTHSLVALVGKCLPFDETFEDLRLAATSLTPYAVAARYPGDLPGLSKEEALEALDKAQQVWNFVIDRLPSDNPSQSTDN